MVAPVAPARGTVLPESDCNWTLVFFTSLPTPAKDLATNPPAQSPSRGKVKLPYKEMSLRVPIFFGAFPLSIKSSKQDVFLMLCKKFYIQYINKILLFVSFPTCFYTSVSIIVDLLVMA